MVQVEHPDSYEGKEKRWGNDGKGKRFPDKWNTGTITTGWRPTCGHEAAVNPATVLDPFAGSGTTIAVAKRLGRRGIGIELWEEYCTLAARRIGAETARLL